MATEQHVEAHEEHHPGPRKYIVIGVILAVLTAVEVGLFYLEATAALIVWMLLITSIAKFLIVVGFFMHLRFDDRRFAVLFFFPLLIMVSIAVALMAMFLSITR